MSLDNPHEDKSYDDEIGGNDFPKLTGFESALASLAPRAAVLDREALFFQAGRAAAFREIESRSRLVGWRWPLAFAGMTAAAAALLVALLLGPRAITAPRGSMVTNVVLNKIAKPQAADERRVQQEDAAASDFAAYARVRDKVLLRGVDAALPRASAVPSSAIASTAPKPYREMLRDALQEM